MGLVSNFNKELSLWFNAHGISNLEFVEGEDFCYYPDEHIVQWGMFDSPNVDNNFQQFFYEYGLNKEYKNPFFISLLHEVAHAMTLPAFSDNEKSGDIIAKQITISEHTIESNYWYWELPTEFAANIWAINWINNNPILAEELYNICMEYLSKIFEDIEILSQLRDWTEELFEGNYSPLCIVEEV